MDYDLDAFRREVSERIGNHEQEPDMTPEKLAEMLPEAFAIPAKKEPGEWVK